MERELRHREPCKREESNRPRQGPYPHFPTTIPDLSVRLPGGSRLALRAPSTRRLALPRWPAQPWCCAPGPS